MSATSDHPASGAVAAILAETPAVMVGASIRERREARGWTQQSLGERLGITQAAVSRWEGGQNEPNLAQLAALADLFGVAIDDLFGREATPTPSEIHPVVAAILAETPLLNGKCLVGSERDGVEIWDGDRAWLVGDETDSPIWGDPTPIAERQAAAARPAIYREVADWIVAEHGQAGPVVKALAIALQLRANELEALADQIEEANCG